METTQLIELIKSAGIWAGMFIACAWYFLSKYLPDERAARQKEREEEKQARTETQAAYDKSLERIINHTEKTQEKISEQFVTVVGTLVGKIDVINTTVGELRDDIEGLQATDGKIIQVLQDLSSKIKPAEPAAVKIITE